MSICTHCTACNHSTFFLRCSYKVRAENLEAAIRAVEANCTGCALKVLSNGSAALSDNLFIGGVHGDLDLVILGSTSELQPVTVWDLNTKKITVTTNKGITTRICFQNLLMKNGRRVRADCKISGGGGAMSVYGHKSGMIAFSMQDCVLTNNEATVRCIPLIFNPDSQCGQCPNK